MKTKNISVLFFLYCSIQISLCGSYCGKGCETCVYEGYCISCGPGYVLSTSGISKNCIESSITITNCQKMSSESSITYCVECNTGYGLTSSYTHATTCTQCSDTTNCDNCDYNPGIC